MNYEKKSYYFFFFPFIGYAQNVIPFIDFNNYFQIFEKENSRIIEFQNVSDYKGGDEFVAYINSKGNLRVFDGESPIDITNLNLEYQVSDHLLTWKVMYTLNMWDAGKMKTLSYNVGNYEVRDSVIVFEDTRFNSVSVYWNGTVYPLYTVIDTIYMPEFIGENIVAFRDNGNFYKLFWNGHIYDIGVWNSGTISFQGGTDVIAFNDPINRTFTLFDKGDFFDVESFFMGKNKGGRGFIVYEDLNNNLIYYGNGKKEILTNFSSKLWEVKDDLVIWNENSFLYAYMNDQKIKIGNFLPTDYKLKNNVFAYRNVMGGVSALVDGKSYEITNQNDSSYEIYGSSVIVKLFNNSYIILKNGKLFTI